MPPRLRSVPGKRGPVLSAKQLAVTDSCRYMDGLDDYILGGNRFRMGY